MRISNAKMMVSALLSIIAFAVSLVKGDTECLALGGTCVDWRYYVCHAGVETGLCLGDTNRRCCLECSTLCQLAENEWQNCCDSACLSEGGKCQHSSNYCSSKYTAGKCGGPTERQCCGGTSTGGGGSACPLTTYATLNVMGYVGMKFKIESKFQSSMDIIDGAAMQCNVDVHILHAFRHEGQENGDGTVKPPTTNSNHAVGHAVDINIETPNGWCDGECIIRKDDSYANCFLEKLKQDGLIWGGDSASPDPVHIDDGLYSKDINQWEALYYELQDVC